MKRVSWVTSFGIVLFLLGGCSNNEAADKNATYLESSSAPETVITEDATSAVVSSEKTPDEESESSESIETEIETESTSSNNNSLSEYSNEEIEYARIWLLLGVNQDIDELNVTKIPAGTPINPIGETSVLYPEDVIQLAGSRLIDGSVTYSSNRDGTINVYHVPLRWESNVPEDLDENYMQDLTQDIMDNTETVYVELGNDPDVINLIDLIKKH